MKATELNGTWVQTVEELKQKFLLLTDSDLLLIEGKQDEILERLHAKIGRTEEENHELFAES